MTLRNSTVHTSSLSLNLSLNTSDLWAPPSPVAPTLVLHPPLPAIIVVLCLFFVFGSCVTFLAVCRWPGMCRPAPCPSWGPDSPVEPQLLLWKRLGSARGSFPAVAVGSFRRPMHPSALGQRRPPESKLELQPPLDRRSEMEQLSIPCLLQYATEI